MPVKLLSFHQNPLEILQDPKARQSLYVHLAILLLLILLGAVNHFHFSKSTNQISPRRLDGSKDELLAKIHSIWVYPIKSCAGVQLVSNRNGEKPGRSEGGQDQHVIPDLEILKKGFRFDRKWCLVDRNPESKNCGNIISLREESRLTLIQPSFSRTKVGDQARKTLKLTISPEFNTKKLPPISTLLEPTDEILGKWKEEKVEIWDDQVFGRVVELVKGENEESQRWNGSASDWISEFLGYRVQLLYFSPPSLIPPSSSAPKTATSNPDLNATGHRKAWPIYRPPSDFASSQGEWKSSVKRQELTKSRGIEFQDEYPFLITSLESLETINQEIQSEVERYGPGGGEKTHSSRPVAGFDYENWKDRKLKMQRFRPNIVLESLNKEEGLGMKPFNEDSFESLFITSPHEPSSMQGSSESKANRLSSAPTESQSIDFKSIIHLVARCERCRLTSVDPDSSEIDKTVPLKFLARKEGGHLRVKKKRVGPCFGVYGIPWNLANDREDYGRIKAGDWVVVRWRPFELDDEPRENQ